MSRPRPDHRRQPQTGVKCARQFGPGYSHSRTCAPPFDGSRSPAASSPRSTRQRSDPIVTAIQVAESRLASRLRHRDEIIEADSLDRHLQGGLYVGRRAARRDPPGPRRARAVRGEAASRADRGRGRAAAPHRLTASRSPRWTNAAARPRSRAMRRSFLKMHGLGNDFVIFDARDTPLEIDAARARAIADRRTGIGCDQLILIEPSQRADVRMRIWNADGGEVEACGNAARCVALLVGGESASRPQAASSAASPRRRRVDRHGRTALRLGRRPARLCDGHGRDAVGWEERRPRRSKCR